MPAPWTEIGPCNFHLRRLAAKVKEGVRAAGGTPMEFNTVSISNGITMGTEGMKASLISCEVIADSIDVAARQLDVALSPGEAAERRAHWQPPAPRYTSGVIAKYAGLVSSASEGAVTA